MTNSARWFERRFEFNFPEELFPNLCMRLRGTPARVEELTSGQSRDVLVRKPEGKWSAQEQVGHLLDLEPLWTARVRDYAAGNSELTAADLSNQKTDRANHNSRALAEILREFRQARLQLLAEIEGLDRAAFERSIPHPRLRQPMRLVDHLYFIAEHDDHHLARVWELLR